MFTLSTNSFGFACLISVAQQHISKQMIDRNVQKKVWWNAEHSYAVSNWWGEISSRLNSMYVSFVSQGCCVPAGGQFILSPHVRLSARDLHTVWALKNVYILFYPPSPLQTLPLLLTAQTDWLGASRPSIVGVTDTNELALTGALGGRNALRTVWGPPDCRTVRWKGLSCIFTHMGLFYHVSEDIS